MNLMKMIDGTLRKERCPQDNWTKGFENLKAMTFPGFEEATLCLQFTGPERFQNFEDVLAVNVVVTWRAVLRNCPANEHTAARFPISLQTLFVGLQVTNVGDKVGSVA